MTRTIQMGMLGLMVALCAGPTLAQTEGNQDRRGGFDRGNFDPAEMRARMMERMKESLGASDEEWTVIEPLLAAVNETQRAAYSTRARFGRGGRGGPGVPPGGGRTGPGGESAPEVEALQTALDSGTTTPEALKTLLGNLRAVRAKNLAAHKKAQDNLRAVLSLEQEAKLVLQGTLE